MPLLTVIIRVILFVDASSMGLLYRVTTRLFAEWAISLYTRIILSEALPIATMPEVKAVDEGAIWRPASEKWKRAIPFRFPITTCRCATVACPILLHSTAQHNAASGVALSHGSHTFFECRRCDDGVGRYFSAEHFLYYSWKIFRQGLKKDAKDHSNRRLVRLWRPSRMPSTLPIRSHATHFAIFIEKAPLTADIRRYLFDARLLFGFVARKRGLMMLHRFSHIIFYLFSKAFWLLNRITSHEMRERQRHGLTGRVKIPRVNYRMKMHSIFRHIFFASIRFTRISATLAD